MFYVLKSSDVLDILVPILYHLNDARADQCKLQHFRAESAFGEITCSVLIIFTFFISPEDG